MPMEMQEKSLTFRGSMAFVDVDFSAPVRNVEALLMGRGTLSAVKVVGQRVRLAAQCASEQDCRKTTILVSANTASA